MSSSEIYKAIREEDPMKAATLTQGVDQLINVVINWPSDLHIAQAYDFLSRFPNSDERSRIWLDFLGYKHIWWSHKLKGIISAIEAERLINEKRRI